MKIFLDIPPAILDDTDMETYSVIDRHGSTVIVSIDRDVQASYEEWLATYDRAIPNFEIRIDPEILRFLRNFDSEGI